MEAVSSFSALAVGRDSNWNLEQFSGWCTGHQAPLSFGEGPGVRFPHCVTYTNLRTAIGLPHQNLQLCFQHLEALWRQQIFKVSNASLVFTSTGGRCAKFGAEALVKDKETAKRAAT